MKLQLQPNEQVIKASNSNHVLEDHSIDGKLVLTNQKRIYFKPSKSENDCFDFTLETKHISDVMYFNSGLFTKGMRLITAEGKDLKFKIKGRESWVKTLSQMI